MRYVRERSKAAEKEEIYRVYVARHLQLIAGTAVSYVELAYDFEPREFDAQAIADDIASRIAEGGANA